jgi:hypothetical protein
MAKSGFPQFPDGARGIRRVGMIELRKATQKAGVIESCRSNKHTSGANQNTLNAGVHTQLYFSKRVV